MLLNVCNGWKADLTRGALSRRKVGIPQHLPAHQFSFDPVTELSPRLCISSAPTAARVSWFVLALRRSGKQGECRDGERCSKQRCLLPD
jgi:hypothetical protein